MEKLTKLNAIHPLLTNPSFTIEESKKLGVSAEHLAYYIKKGLIKRLGRGIYQSTSYQGAPENFQWEDLIEAANSIQGGIIG